MAIQPEFFHSIASPVASFHWDRRAAGSLNSELSILLLRRIVASGLTGYPHVLDAALSPRFFKEKNMWVRQCEIDAERDAPLPIPSRIASNEEFIPPPQSPQQKEYEARLTELSAQAAQRQGLNRRDFLRTGSGMAAALLALNQVFGDCYDVSAEEVEDPKAFKEKWPKDQF